MKYNEFSNIALAIHEAYPSYGAMSTTEGVQVWYEMLKDLEYDSVTRAVQKHIQTSPFAPTIADIRKRCEEMKYPVWSREWMRLLNGAKSRELNEPGQYAMKILTRDYFESCRDNSSRIGQCMKEFEKLYKEYAAMSIADKEQFTGSAMFQVPIATIAGGQGDGK